MYRCCGITKKGERCRRHTHMKTPCYGIDFPVCNFHNEQNTILEWSRRGKACESTPREIEKYLDIFWSLSEQVRFMRTVPLVMMTTYIYRDDKDQDLSDPYTLRDKFYEHLFVNEQSDGDEDCPVCFENKQEVKTACQHGYCRACIYQWCDMRGTCPMCREHFIKII